jgi:hypothetical protein
VRFAFLLSTVVVTISCAEMASAADLAKVDRTIRREPIYKGKPKYCLMVFGPAARDRVWLVLDDEALYVDRNGNGDLTEEGKRIKFPEFTASDHPIYHEERSIKAGTVTVGGLTHTDLELNQCRCRRKIEGEVDDLAEWQDQLDSIWRQLPDGIIHMVSLKLDPNCYQLFDKPSAASVLHFAWVDTHGFLALSARAESAPVLHFGGPLTIQVNPNEKLRRGNDPPRTTLLVGTHGLGAGSFVTTCYDLVPKEVRPVVEIRFPPKAPGHEPVIRKYVLKERC